MNEADRLDQLLLFLWLEKSGFKGGGEGNLSLIQHLHKLRDQLRDLQVALELFRALAGFLPHDLDGFLSLVDMAVPAPFAPADLLLHRFIFHLVGECLFTGQDLVPVHVRIHHADHGVFVCQDPDDHGELAKSELLGGVFSAVAGDDLIYTLWERTDDQRGQDPVSADAVDQVFHLLVVLHFEGVAVERAQALHLNLHDPLVVTGFVVVSRHVHAPSFRWWRSGAGERGVLRTRDTAAGIKKPVRTRL